MNKRWHNSSVELVFYFIFETPATKNFMLMEECQRFIKIRLFVPKQILGVFIIANDYLHGSYLPLSETF